MKRQQKSMIDKCRVEKKDIIGHSKGSGSCHPPIPGRAVRGEADMANKGQELFGCVVLRCLCQVSRNSKGKDELYV